MTLRTRLFLTGLAVAVPLAVAWFLVDTRMRLATKEDELRQSVAFDLATGLKERCEADPPRTGRPGRGGDIRPAGPSREPAPRADRPQDGPPRPPRDDARRPPRGSGASGAYEFFAYDAGGRPSAADAPPLPADRSGAAGIPYLSSSGPGISIVVPLGDRGPCAYLLARIPPRPDETRDQTQALLLVVVGVLAAAWFAAGPIIGRLRRLADGVRASAASRYATPVEVEGPAEIAAVAGAFNEAGRQARAHLAEVQAREEALRDFVANTTHDVAIPLSVLQGHLADLDRKLASTPEQAAVRGAVREAHYMGSLLRNLGAATRLDERRAALQFTPTDLSAVVRQLVDRHRAIARASDVEINVAVPDPPLVAPTDQTLFEQAVGNLVDNAVRYNRPGGHVAVVLDRAGDAFVLSVTDDGPGVTEEDLAHLTTRWFRGPEARTRRPDGRGLGLAIASESIARMDMTLAFTRPPAGGLRAEIRGAATPD